MSTITLLALIYTHLQIQIIDLAYQGKRKENQIVELSESNGRLVYQILKMKSSSNLGGKLLASDSQLHFRDNQSVVELIASQGNTGKTGKGLAKASKQNPILSFLSLKSQAEARPEDKIKRANP